MANSKNRLSIAIVLLFHAALSLGCTQSRAPAYDEPVEVSIARLKELYKGDPVTIVENYVIEGVVISTDKWGNFRRSIFVQDATGGIEVKLDTDKIFTAYYLYGKVRIYCKNLSLGAYGRLVQLGGAPTQGYEVGYMARDDIAGHIEYLGAPEEELLPLSLDMEELTAANAGRIAGSRVSFDKVRFEQGDGTTRWCEPEPAGGLYTDTERLLLDSKGNSLIVRTLHNADFADMPLPQGEIRIEGVLSWFNDSYQLRVNNETDVYR